MIDEKKLIERLEEFSGKAEQNMNYYDELSLEDESYNVPAGVSRKKYEVYQKVLDIVNQLAEEHNNDFCEWKFETTGIVWHCNGCETYNLPYAMNLMIIADDFECKCPHCGKKIKVVE